MTVSAESVNSGLYVAFKGSSPDHRSAAVIEIIAAGVSLTYLAHDIWFAPSGHAAKLWAWMQTCVRPEQPTRNTMRCEYFRKVARVRK